MTNDTWKMREGKWIPSLLLTLALFLVSGLTTFAQTPTSAPQTPDLQVLIARQAALVTEFDVNGLKGLVKRRAGSQTVAAGLFLKGGSRNITASNAGIESLMLNVAAEGSAAYPREKLRAELARTGTVIGASDNYDYSVLSVTCTRANFDSSWNVFTDVALHPAFAKEDFDLIKQRSLVALSDDADDPDTYLQRLQEQAAYIGHPYFNRPEGTVESVSGLTLEDIRRYHQQVMQTSRLLLIVVGDIDANQLKTRLAGSFGTLPRGTYKAEAEPQLSFSASTVQVTQRGLPPQYVPGLFTAPPITSP